MSLPTWSRSCRSAAPAKSINLHLSSPEPCRSTSCADFLFVPFDSFGVLPRQLTIVTIKKRAGGSSICTQSTTALCWCDKRRVGALGIFCRTAMTRMISDDEEKSYKTRAPSPYHTSVSSSGVGLRIYSPALGPVQAASRLLSSLS